jgi:DNA/RNA-binding domain of Phe-tRNA-synthetase-like protein
MTTYTPQRAHLVASNTIGQTQLLSSSIRTMAKIIDLVPQNDRAELIRALDKLAQAVAQLNEAVRSKLSEQTMMF